MGLHFVTYYCTTCYTCKKPAEPTKTIKFCSGCKLIQYCSVEHQKQDWLNHKQLCKSIQNAMKNLKIGHVYENARALLPEEQNKWNFLKSYIGAFLKLTLQRPLTNPEKQMVYFPPVCSYCRIYKSDSLFICNLCKTVMYCCREHQSLDKEHLDVCKFLALSFEVNMLRFHEQNTLFVDFLKLLNQCRVNKCPENMEIFIKSLTSTLSCRGIYYSEFLSYPLTLIHVISKIAKISANQLTIHIVGAENVDELLAMQSFHYLLPHIIHLNIILIGPRLTESDSIPLCIEGSKITLSSVKLLYHEYVVSSKFVTPDIIAAMSQNICQYESTPSKDLWKQSLPYFLRFKNTVVTITSYTERESVKVTKRLCSFKHEATNFNMIVECQENPFSSLYAHRDWESKGLRFANKYISVVKT